MSAYRLVFLSLGLGLIPLAGCASKPAELTGTVKLKGQPLASGVVTFFPEEPEAEPVAVFVENGAYTIPEIAYGVYRVTVTPKTEMPEARVIGSGRTLKPWETDPEALAAPAPKKPAGPVIPEKYHSVNTSGLTTKVDQPAVTYPITLD